MSNVSPPRCARARLSLAVALALTVGAAAPFAAQATPAADDGARSFHIAPGPIASALREFGAAAGVAVTLEPESDATTVAVPGLEGEYAVEQGLAMLLDASGYEAVAAADGYKVRRSRKQRGDRQLGRLTVTAPFPGYLETTSESATRTLTPLRDVPQAVSVLGAEAIRDLAIHSLADATRYLPGVGIAQGEGNRDQPVIRGNSTTADLFVDGIRDDVQYIRDLYNVERLEALNGPNAMVFGRGGAGGVLNRVLKKADWSELREVTLEAGSWNALRASADIAEPLNDAVALRVTAMAEDSDSYRDDVEVQRHGINPTLSFRAGENTVMTLGYERFDDERTADRGVSSFQGRPLDTDPGEFFGDPERSNSEVTVDAFDAILEHRFAGGARLRNHTRWAQYDKFYENVFPAAVVANGTQVQIQAYNQATDRRNLFNQSDLTFDFTTGAVEHRFLVGAELGRQETDNFRNTGFFTSVGANTSTITVPVASPRTGLPITFRQAASDADNHGTVDVAALYVQDQLVFSPQWSAVLGLRYDNFDVDFRNNRNGVDIETSDGELSPRAGLVYKPVEAVSLYASYGNTFVPRAGEQLSSLTPSNAALAPEEFENVELGAKWDIRADLFATAAVYRLDRGNVAVADPADPTRSILVDAQRTKGVELGLGGYLTDSWQLFGGYAYQDGEITRDLSTTVPAGNTIAQTPRHTLSLWNRYDFSPTWGVGLGAIHRSSLYPSTDNAVTVPAFTRFDAAVYYAINDAVSMQLNVENLFDREYFASAHSNTNIMPGSPRAFRLGVSFTF